MSIDRKSIEELYDEENNDFYKNILYAAMKGSSGSLYGLSCMWYEIMPNGFIYKYADYIDWDKASRCINFEQNIALMFFDRITSEIKKNSSYTNINYYTRLALERRFENEKKKRRP